MAWSGTTFSLLYNWVSRRDAGLPTKIIDADTMLAQDQDFADGLEACIKHNGDIAASANLPMGGFLHTNVGAATARTNYARVAEVQDCTPLKAASTGGSIDAMTGTLTPAITAYAANMIVTIVAPGSGANTSTTPTINLNSLGAKTLKKHQAAITAGDYSAGDLLMLVYDGTYFDLINPKNTPASVTLDLNTLTTDSTGGATGDFLTFVDVSGANSSDKVTVQDLFTNVFANFTADATGGATGDKLLFSDASESNAAQTVTVDNLLINGLQLLTTDSTGGATADFLAFADASESNVGNKVLVSDFVYNFLNNGTADTTPDPDADHVLTRDNSASGYKKVLIKNLAVHANADGIGYKGAPVVASDSTTSFALTDCGKLWYHTSGSAHTWTIPANASVAFPIGTVILLENESGGGNVTVAITTDTLRWGSSTGSRTLAANGSAAIKKVAATVWRMTGTGIT